MKKFLITIALILFAAGNVFALNYNEGYRQLGSKPMVLLVTAPWASNAQFYRNQFQKIQNVYGANANFVVLDIATKDAAAYNSFYPIYPNLPYVMTFQGSGRFTKVIQRDCMADYSCFNERVKDYLD